MEMDTRMEMVQMGVLHIIFIRMRLRLRRPLHSLHQSSSSHRTLTKSRPSNQQRPTPPASPEQPPRSRASIINTSTRKHSPPPASSTTQNHSPPPRTTARPVITPQEFEHSSRRVAILDEDLFARSGGVRTLSPFSQEDDLSLPLLLEHSNLASAQL